MSKTQNLLDASKQAISKTPEARVTVPLSAEDKARQRKLTECVRMLLIVLALGAVAHYAVYTLIFG